MHKEIEARFLEIDEQQLKRRLLDLGATDKGELMLSETIFYDKDGKWHEENRYVRIRTADDKTNVTYKQNKEQTIDSAQEIEFTVSNPRSMQSFLENIGLVASRHQEKKRHTFELNDVTVDIDTWPKVPTYVELEGPSEEAIKSAAEALGFSWSNAVFDDARAIIQSRYNIPVGTMRWFTFDRFE